MKRLALAAALLAATASSRAAAQDAATLARIRDEGMNRSHVLELFDHLTTVIGPRLTASPAFKQSVDWAAQTLRGFGLANVHLEAWPFGRGWSLEGQVAEMTAPRYMSLIAYAEAWSPPTGGIVEGRPVYIGDLANEDSVRAHAAAIRGAIVLATKPQETFITSDRPQPTEHEQPVAVGQPRPRNAAGPLPRQTMLRTLHDLGAAAVREKFYIYLNNDPGTGRIYGWYAEGNGAAKAIFDEWMAPLQDLGMRRNVMEKIGATDHLSFTALGLPGFNTIQDYAEYDTRIHHTNMDTFERVDPEALKQAAVVLASFAYDAAMRDGAFPRGSATP